LQLPFVPGVLPGVGSKPGQHGLLFLELEVFLVGVFGLEVLADFFAVDFFAVVIVARMSRLHRPDVQRK